MDVLQIEPRLFKFPRLYLDYLEGKLPGNLGVAEMLSRSDLGPQRESVSDRADFWGDVLEYDRRLGGSGASLENIQGLASGKSVSVVTGQQPGLLGGPLYTLYKIVTAVCLSDYLKKNEGLNAVPVLWNASDDTDFLEVSSATFFNRDFQRRRFFIDEAHHSPRKMVGHLDLEMLKGVIRDFLREFGSAPYAGAAYVSDCLEGALSSARDWGEFFSALYLRVFSREGLVVVDARRSVTAGTARRVFSKYIKAAESVEARALDVLERIRNLGYDEPVSARSLEVCVFLKEGDSRRKLSREELPRALESLEKGDVTLLPNVILGPALRTELMRPVADVLGPSEVSYSLVSRAVYDSLGLKQEPVFPRLSLTVVPSALIALTGSEREAIAELILSFDRRLHDHLEQSLSVEVSRGLSQSEAEVRGGLDRVKTLAGSVGKGTENVIASASRKMEFELKRIREEFVSASKKSALSSSPQLRGGGEVLLPNGNLQERGYCSLAPLVYAGESFITTLRELAAIHVSECFEERIHHYALVAEIT
jgi:bacillithiol biosynthesis cysteine-adding enzyme BshC